MTWQNDSGAGNEISAQQPVDAGLIHTASQPAIQPHGATTSAPEIRVGRRFAALGGKDVDVFTMTLGSETIDLLPIKTWAQLDLYKWRVQGKLPGTPAGLEIALDHIKLMGQTVMATDPEGCAKLEALFAEWLAMEREALLAAKRKAQLKAAAPASAGSAASEQSAIRFTVELDKEGQVHIRCMKGKEVLALIGLNTPGFQSLINQGWMRKPHALKTGVLHDWLELDGTLYSFEHGKDSSAELARALNESYLPPATGGKANEVVVYANAASPTGFDIQFPAKVGGVLENRRRPLGEESLALLQDLDHCGLVHKGLVIKLSRPCFIFKQKTADGGERYLEKCAENIVKVSDEDGMETVIDLSQPVNYLHLRALDLTAIFNHPTVNRHAKAAPSESAQAPPPKSGPAAVPAVSPAAAPVHPSPAPAAPVASAAPPKVHQNAPPRAEPVSPKPFTPPPAPPPKAHELVSARRDSGEPNPGPAPATPAPPPPARAAVKPNLWLKPVLEQQPIRFDWFTCLVYAKLATWAGNSSQARFLDSDCWYIQLGDAADLADPAFKGVFDTRTGSFGFVSGGYMIRFENGSIFLGRAGSELKAADARLLALGIDSAQAVVFIVSDGYRSRFGVPDPQVAASLAELKARGGILMSVREALETAEPLAVLWTVPAPQSATDTPEAIEHLPPPTTR